MKSYRVFDVVGREIFLRRTAMTEKKAIMCVAPTVLVLVLQSLSGCALSGENIFRKGMVTVQRVPSARVEIPWADAYRD